MSTLKSIYVNHVIWHYSFLEPSMLFHHVTWVCDLCDLVMWPVTVLHFVFFALWSTIKYERKKIKRKEKKVKLSLLSLILTLSVYQDRYIVLRTLLSSLVLLNTSVRNNKLGLFYFSFLFLFLFLFIFLF